VPLPLDELDPFFSIVPILPVQPFLETDAVGGSGEEDAGPALSRPNPAPLDELLARDPFFSILSYPSDRSSRRTLPAAAGRKALGWR
jgi:hypothetical protein